MCEDAPCCGCCGYDSFEIEPDEMDMAWDGSDW